MFICSQFNFLYPNCTHTTKITPYKAYKFKLCRVFGIYSNSISETISSNFIMFLKLHVVSYIRYFHVFFCVLEENADIFMTLTSKVIIAQEQKERQWNFEYFQAFYCFWGHCRIFTFAFRVFFWVDSQQKTRSKTSKNPLFTDILLFEIFVSSFSSEFFQK